MTPAPRSRLTLRGLVLVASGATLLSSAPLALAETPQDATRVTVTEANAAAQKWAPLAYD